MSGRTREKMLTCYVIKLLPLREFFLTMVMVPHYQTMNGVTFCQVSPDHSIGLRDCYKKGASCF